MSKMNENNINSKEKSASLSSDNNTNTYRKRKKYKEFIRLIRSGEYGAFYEIAKKIGINRETVARWYYTKPAQKAADLAAEESVSRIKLPTPSWRDHARMLDRLIKHNKTLF